MLLFHITYRDFACNFGHNAFDLVCFNMYLGSGEMEVIKRDLNSNMDFGS